MRAVPEVASPRLGAKTLEPDAFRRFLRVVELEGSPRDRAIVYLLLSGLRVSEVAGLHRDDLEINAHRGLVRIRGEHVKRSSYREVPLSRQARIYVAAHLNQLDPQGAVFVGERGPLTTDGTYKIVKKYGELAGVELHPHVLRHEFAMRYLAGNQNDLVGLKALLGHAQLETTAKFYSRKRLEDLRVGVERIEL